MLVQALKDIKVYNQPW
ncbi:hypothetical protein HaLaN_22073 [Haematococcus lacustris]|uniref:Uncharacterized protein n=1 Tax=Haematococcus lacustris TaxID=44745 RepID=A0A699ZQW6_HAELA|nr:hypothetical protein HaLaN_22073 [Haematococcus lacustris]